MAASDTGSESSSTGPSKDLIYSTGTQVVILCDVLADNGRILHPRGAVGVVIRPPADLNHSYRIRFPDDVEEPLRRDEIVMLSHFQQIDGEEISVSSSRSDLYERVIFRCVIGSRAYGLDDSQSDVDYRGVFLPRADQQWSLYGVPEQIEAHGTQEHYWELQRFLVLALKSNPNVLECLYSPLVEKVTPLGKELIQMREYFLSRLVYQTYNGYVLSQFRKMQSDVRNQGQVKWKHVMHLIRLLIGGIQVLQKGFVAVRVERYRDELLAIRRGEMPWEDVDRWRLDLHRQFHAAFDSTELPERPDYERVNDFLIRARRAATQEALP